MSNDEKKLFAMAQKLAEQMQTNELDLTIRNRIASAISGGYDFADTLHSVYLDFGYPAQLNFFNFWNMYRRFGIARNACDLFPNYTWITAPTIEGSAAFLRDLEQLQKQVKFWQRMSGLDKRQRVGRYAGMFMRVRDGKQPHEPLEGIMPGMTALVAMVPLYEGQLTVQETITDIMDDDYGLPKMYQYTTGGSGNRNEKNSASFNIHPSRIIIAAEGADDGNIYGIPAIEGCYNSLMDLRKIIGGGAEGFYKNASQTTVFSIKDSANAAVSPDLLDKFNEKYDDFARNRMRRGFLTPGIDAKTLESNLASPKEHFNIALADVASNLPCPATVLIGQQTGRLASQEDGRMLLSTINSRREGYGTELLMSVFDWLIEYGILPASDYEIKWDDLLALSDAEKLENVAKMAEVNAKQYSSGGMPVFSTEEMREAAGYDEPMDDEGMFDEPDEGDDDGEQDQD